MTGTLKVGFLVCPPESLLDGFAHRPADLDPDLVKAVSSHLARCAPCREEVDLRRRGLEAARARRPWVWALAALAVLSAGAIVFLWREPTLPAAEGALRFAVSYTGSESGVRPDPRIAALARFDPPDDAVVMAGVGRTDGVTSPSGRRSPALTPEDQRELGAARSRLRADAYVDAAELLEDLAGRHPTRGGFRLLLAYAYARAGDFEKAQRQYALADELGAGVEACIGLANASLALGDVAGARRELADHVIARRPDDESARALLERINASRQRLPH